jgi:hypothetical protein
VGGLPAAGGTGGQPDSGPASNKPVVLSFSASPANLPAGGGQTTLNWEAQGATTLSIDQGVGAVSSTSKAVSVTATTIFTLTATGPGGSATSTTAVVVGQNPSSEGNRYVAMVSPTSGESFSAPASLRLVAAAHDPNVYTNSPSQGLGGNAAKVQFFVDDAVVLEVDGANAEYWVFKGTTSNVAAGSHRIWARGIYVNPALVLDSPPALVTVADPPAYDRTVALDADVVLSGSQGYELLGTADKRIRLNGNGHRIISSAAATGKLTLAFVDAFDIGNRTTTSEPGVDVTTSGNVTIEDSTFDSSNTLRASVDGAATASVRRNLFRSNMRQPIGQEPGGTTSFPAVVLKGKSTGAKVFAGNNIGAGWVLFDQTQGWIVGGDTDADSNVAIGPRVGIYVSASTDVAIRRNFTHHVYYGGWSQGSNYELGGIASVVAEHNVIQGSSWPVRGVGGEFRYNIVADAGHQWLWADNSNGAIHHNLFIGGQADVGGIYVLYSPTGVRIFNNTFDAELSKDIVTVIKLTNGALTLTSNAFLNVPSASVVSVEGGTLTADYNFFFNPSTKNYSDGRTPAHDVGVGTTVDPKLTDPAKAFTLDEVSIWQRKMTVREVLSAYRTRYTPQAGSPLIDTGDPAGAAGNDIGAVGAGAANTADKFGQL